MDTDIDNVESDDIEEAGEQLANASDSASKSLKQKARIFVVGTVISLAVAFTIAVVTGVITLSLDLQATADISFIVVWLGWFFTAFIIAVFTTIFLWAAPGNYIRGVTKAAAALYEEE